jgi:hypothetical protein
VQFLAEAATDYWAYDDTDLVAAIARIRARLDEQH